MASTMVWQTVYLMVSHTMVVLFTMASPLVPGPRQLFISHRHQDLGHPTEHHDHVPELVTEHVRLVSLTWHLTSTAYTVDQPLRPAATGLPWDLVSLICDTVTLCTGSFLKCSVSCVGPCKATCHVSQGNVKHLNTLIMSLWCRQLTVDTRETIQRWWSFLVLEFYLWLCFIF